jgi:hypothetical protein
MPKSQSFTRPSSSRNRLAGLISRCTMPRECAAASASAAWATSETASSIGTPWGSWSRTVRRSRPVRSSITRKISSSCPSWCSSMSKVTVMPGCWSPAVVSASRRKRSTADWSCAMSAGRIFIATGRRSRRSTPRQTSPMPPAPIRPSRRYRPPSSSPCSILALLRTWLPAVNRQWRMVEVRRTFHQNRNTVASALDDDGPRHPPNRRSAYSVMRQYQDFSWHVRHEKGQTVLSG